MTDVRPLEASRGLLPDTGEEERRLVERARRGDKEALDRLLAAMRRPVLGYAYRMVTRREDAEDAVQETLFRVARDLPRFRGEARFRTWVFGIATHVCLDLLRQRARWRRDTQLDGEIAARADRYRMAEIGTLMTRADVRFEIREHIAFCFSCVARTLEPRAQAALMLKEIVGLSLQEAAQALELSEPRYRHLLSDARRHMRESFDGLCQLVNKTGACWQCRGLRELAPAEKRGEDLVRIELGPGVAMTPESLLDARIDIARNADLEGGAARVLHDDLFEALNRDELGPA